MPATDDQASGSYRPRVPALRVALAVAVLPLVVSAPAVAAPDRTGPPAQVVTAPFPSVEVREHGRCGTYSFVGDRTADTLPTVPADRYRSADTSSVRPSAGAVGLALESVLDPVMGGIAVPARDYGTTSCDRAYAVVGIPVPVRAAPGRAALVSLTYRVAGAVAEGGGSATAYAHGTDTTFDGGPSDGLTATLADVREGAARPATAGEHTVTFRAPVVLLDGERVVRVTVVAQGGTKVSEVPGDTAARRSAARLPVELVSLSASAD